MCSSSVQVCLEQVYCIRKVLVVNDICCEVNKRKIPEMADSSSFQIDDSMYILGPLLSTTVRNDKFHLLIKACNEQQTLAGEPENKVKNVVSTVNARLNELGQRSSGIQLLRTLLDQCSDSVFVENSVSWMKQCIRAAANDHNAHEAWEVLCLLLEMSHHFQELTKPVTAEIIPKMLDHLTKQKSAAALQCLEAVLHYYPGPCKTKAKIVQKFLLMFLDEEDKTLVGYASRCMCYLPLLLTAGNNDGSTWTNMLTELCATASTVMFGLFENVHEVAVPPALTELPVGFKLKSLKIDSPLVSLRHLATRLTNIFSFIEGMLLGELPNVKAIRSDLLIALAYRALAVNCKMVSRGKTLEHVALVCVLPDIHVAVLNLLQTLVACCNGGLLKYGPLFCKLVLQTLKWSKMSCGNGVERPFRHLREAAYKFLESWVTRAKAASCVELVCEELITQMLEDVYQRKESVTLQFQKKGKTSSQAHMPPIRQQLANPKANFGTCEAALRALSAIIESSGSLLSATLHMRLQEVVITLLLNIKLSSGPKEMPTPYSVIGCRMQLYRLLLALSLHPHPRWPPPTQFSLALFSLGQNDCSLEVAGFCNFAVACTRQMVHPSQSSHQFPISVDEMRASVGLPNLEAVRGLNPNLKKGQNKAVLVETDPNVRASRTPEKLHQTSLPEDSVGKKVIQSPNIDKRSKKKRRSSFNEMSLNGIESSPNTITFSNSLMNSLPEDSIGKKSPNIDKRPKKKPRVSFNEVSLNGIELSPNTSSDTSIIPKKKRRLLSESDHDKKSSTISDNLNKKHLQFTVEELVSSSGKRTVLKSGQDWEVTDVMEVSEKPVENKSTKSANTQDPNIKITSLHISPKKAEGPKIRKVNESPSKPNEISNEVLSNNLLDSNNDCNSETSISAQLSVSRNVTSDRPNVTINDMSNRVDPSVITNDSTGDSDCYVVDEVKNVQERKVEREETKVGNRTDVEKEKHENEKRKSGDSSPSKELSQSSPNQSSSNSSQNVSCAAKDEVKASSPVSKSPDVSDCKSEEINSPKTGNQDEEVLPSSESEIEQKKLASGLSRRITRSLAKRTSTPNGDSEQPVSSEELPSSQENLDTNMLNDISRLEEESKTAGTDQSIELSETDESAPFVLRIESDRESVEICDVTNDKTDDPTSAVKEKSEAVASVKQTSTSGSPSTPSSKSLKDSVTSDREIEEVSEEMEAVVDSPNITVEEVSACDKENTTKKSAKEAGDDGSGSETNEEEILASFVDAIQPKSE